MRTFIRAAVAALALAVAAVSPVAATQPHPDHKVGICHRTASQSNPYVYISVDEAAVDTHLHNGKGHPAKKNKDGSPRNDYLASSAADCVSATPTATPTSTPTFAPSTSPSPTSQVSPTPTPTPSPSPTVEPRGGPSSEPSPTPSAQTTPSATPSATPTSSPIITPEPTPAAPTAPPTDAATAGVALTYDQTVLLLVLGAVFVVFGVYGYRKGFGK